MPNDYKEIGITGMSINHFHAFIFRRHFDIKIRIIQQHLLQK